LARQIGVASSFSLKGAMESTSRITGFIFALGQFFRFGSLNFLTDDFDKLSLSGLDSNQPEGSTNM
jgi:hypothetical protein